MKGSNSNLIILIIIILILLSLVILRKYDLLTFNIDDNPSNKVEDEIIADSIKKDPLVESSNKPNIKEGLESIKSL